MAWGLNGSSLSKSPPGTQLMEGVSPCAVEVRSAKGQDAETRGQREEERPRSHEGEDWPGP